MARFRSPAVTQLRRAQLTLIFVALVPTILTVATGIVLLAVRSEATALVAGVLALAFCMTSITGYIIGTIFVSRGASVARFQNEFLSSVSHELRTPLTSISIFIETLRDQRLTDPEEKQKCLELLEQEVDRLGGLVERLMDLSKLEAGRHGFDREDVLISDVIGEAMVAFDAATLSEPVELDLDIEDGIRVRGDRSALAQALTNLLINAWKHSPTGEKHIEVSARAQGKRVEISVVDNGPGIPRNEQRKIFWHFERGRAAVDGATQGSGLGLAIVRAIIRGHRGRIDVRSKPGRGSEFRIRLPRREAAA